MLKAKSCNILCLNNAIIMQITLQHARKARTPSPGSPSSGGFIIRQGLTGDLQSPRRHGTSVALTGWRIANPHVTLRPDFKSSRTRKSHCNMPEKSAPRCQGQFWRIYNPPGLNWGFTIPVPSRHIGSPHGVADCKSAGYLAAGLKSRRTRIMNESRSFTSSTSTT